MNKIFTLITGTAIFLVSCNNSDQTTDNHRIIEKKQDIDTSVHTTPLVIWFTNPAPTVADSLLYSINATSENKAWDEALPIGNGRLGAMVFGGAKYERIQLNEESLWSFPTSASTAFTSQDIKEIQSKIFEKKYAEAQNLVDQKMIESTETQPQYQPLSDLMLEMTDIDENSVTDYYRDLHIDSAIATVHYHVGDKLFSREIFASSPANIMVMKISCNQPGSINAKISLQREADAETFRSPFDSTLLIQRGKLVSNGLQFETQIKAVYKGGTVRNDTKKIIAQNVDELYIYISGATNFKEQNHALFAKTLLLNAIAKPYEDLRNEHISDYKSIFSRLELNLNFKDKAYDIPTDKRVEKVKNGTEDKYLTELLFQYGRYLLISSSRTKSFPAHLQGIWNERLTSSEGSGYKIPFSLPFIYSFVETTALAELKNPLYNILDSIAKYSKNSSMNQYGTDGIYALDKLKPNGNISNQIQSNAFVAPLGLAWMSNTIIESYKYSKDTDILKAKIYPFLKNASLFISNILVEVPSGNALEGKLVVCPSSSYGNSFEAEGNWQKIGYASSIDQTLVRDLFKNTLYAIEELSSNNYKFDPSHKSLIESKLKQLAVVEDTSKSVVKEWLSDVDGSAIDGNNPLPMMYQIYPSIYFTKPKDVSALLQQMKKEVLPKVKNSGFVNAYAAVIMARLNQPKLADDFLLEHLKNSVSKNLLSSNPPFSLEGNSLFTNAVSEMMLQSYNEEIQFAPALPGTWEEGNIKGFRAEGGFNCNLEWKGSKVYATLLSTKGKDCKIRSKSSIKVYSAGKEVETEKIAKDLYIFKTNTAASYSITLSNSSTEGADSKGLGIMPDLGLNLGLGL